LPSANRSQLCVDTNAFTRRQLHSLCSLPVVVCPLTAQAKPATTAQPIQRGAAKGQTKIQGQNLKAAVNESRNPAINGHSVSLSCAPSISPGVTGYNFYQGATKGAESATPLNVPPTSTCSWIDGTVIGTNTYWYTAKAYCPTCSPPRLFKWA
jgi:hypothetical protein